MKVTICKERRMAMAHRPPYHDGKCSHMHGHTYVVRVYVSGPVQSIEADNPQSGMVADFGQIKTFLADLEEKMDHQFANETLDEYPTAERMALRILQLAQAQLDPVLPVGTAVSKVRVYEEYVAPQAFAEVEA